MSPLRIAAIDFLNPAPLMWDFEHPPEAARLAQRYLIERMTPAQCAARLADGTADLGLIPIAAYAGMAGLAVVPGCTVASLGPIRSILLVLRAQPGVAVPQRASQTEPDRDSPALRRALRAVGTVALDTASRTSAMYTQILFRKYWRHEPHFALHSPDLEAMLATSDAALLIGDPALYALEARAAREARTGEKLLYLDLGDAWHQQTGLPWVSAFWAARLGCLGPASGGKAGQIAADFQASRDAGLAHLPELAAEWSARLSLPRATVATYLTHNIHYRLDEPCLNGIRRFYADARDCGLLPKLPELTFL